ncbi:glycosyltransferase [Chloroflexota bacterium]
MKEDKNVLPLADGTVYSKRKNFCPFSVHPLQDYSSILGEEKLEKLQRAAQRLEGLKLLEINATAQGGGVAEMLYSAIPFLNMLGIETEWKIIHGNNEYFEYTKRLHNLLQGMEGSFTSEMKQCYMDTLQKCAEANLIDYNPDVVLVHDPQPLGLISYLKKPGETWLWRCHIDIEEAALRANPGLWEFITSRTEKYDAAIFSAVYYIVSRWPLPKFIIPPFIDPLSEKNRELSQREIDEVLTKYQIDPRVPIVGQIGRFDPWKGIDRTIAVYREVRKKRKCQLVLAGGLASDDPEGKRILDKINDGIKGDGDIHVLNLQMADRLQNWREVNALQRATSVIMQPSTKEGFGLVVTEGLWKGKPVIAGNVGAIPLQISNGTNGYFYETPQKTAQKVEYLLDNPKAANMMGKRGKEYVQEHFLLPDRITDYLMALDMAVKGAVDKKSCSDCIISFHPWFKLTKRK